jgi:hypothetical protein
MMARLASIEANQTVTQQSGVSMSIGEVVPVAIPVTDAKEATFGKRPVQSAAPHRDPPPMP